MANTKRTQKEIEMDCKRLKEAAKTATSLKDLERETGLSYAMINTTLSKHPTIFKRIKAQLATNLENAELELQKKKEEEDKAKKEALKKTEIATEENKETSETKSSIGFVIDASITGIEDLRTMLSKVCQTKAKLILTSVTIKELERMQKFKDIDGNDARYILALAAENSNSFENVLIDETLDTPDDCIIKYCADNKDRVTLLTSDKTMALKARMYAVQVQYFKQTKNSSTNTMPRINYPTNSKIRTLIPASRIGNQLLISNFHTHNMSICVCSNGLEYTDGIKELKVGDDVFIATKKADYITFAHYRMVSLYAENNCELMYSKRFYDYGNFDVPKAAYKSFLKDFKVRHDL